MTTLGIACDAPVAAQPVFVATTRSADAAVRAWRDGESVRRARHPISRWLICPLAESIAERMATTRLLPTHVSLLGGILALAAAACLAFAPERTWWAACGRGPPARSTRFPRTWP